MSWLEQRWYDDKPALCILKPLSALYRFLSQRKRRKDLQQQWHAPVPVVIVGNISVGGTGKTPFTIYLVDLLRANGFSPGIISRGYKSQTKSYPYDVSKAGSARLAGDEAFMLHSRCECPVIIDPDRRSAAKYLLAHYDCDIIISDDGLQHYRLGRDIELAVIDGARGLGNQELIPAGPLREPPERLKDVDFVITNGSSASVGFAIEQHLMKLEPLQFRSVSNNETIAIADWEKPQVHAVAGIGNPQRFFKTLKDDLNIEIIEHPQQDHHHYTESDFQFDKRLPIVMTEKDAVKAKELNIEDAWYLEVHAELDEQFASEFLHKLQQTKR